MECGGWDKKVYGRTAVYMLDVTTACIWNLETVQGSSGQFSEGQGSLGQYNRVSSNVVQYCPVV